MSTTNWVPVYKPAVTTKEIVSPRFGNIPAGTRFEVVVNMLPNSPYATCRGLGSIFSVYHDEFTLTGE